MLEDTKTLICQKCGKEFQVGRGKNGNYLRRLYCENCSTMTQKYKDITCKECGKTFQVGRTSDGRHFIRRTVCDDCLKPKQPSQQEIKLLICEKCGKQFKAQISKTTNKFLYRKYCPACDISLHDTKEVICEKCGKIFTVGRNAKGKFYNRRYCDECNHPTYKEVICKNCSKIFKVTRLKSGQFSNRQFCCSECEKEHNKKLKEKDNIKNDDIIPKSDYEKKKYFCQKCGKEIPYYRKYCEECSDINKPTRVLVCQKCGKEFTVGRGKEGHFLRRKYCDDCLKPVQSKELICQQCGNTFIVERKNNKIDISRKLCDSCLNRKEDYKTLICQQCGNKFQVGRSKTTGDFLQREYCDDCLNRPTNMGGMSSKLSYQFSLLLQKSDLVFDTEFRLENKYFDFKLSNILLELDPTYTHTTSELSKFHISDKNYHINKTKLAIENNYHCIHIWQWDDWEKILSILKPKQTLYARKLNLMNIDKQTVNDFIEQYHLQGKCRGNQVNIGLYQNNELVQVMTFGKPRYNKNYEWELLRLCSHSDYAIVGGAERLFNYFVKQYNPESVISYCDISKFTGDVYNKLGFTLIRQTEPQKIWSYYNKHITDSLLRQQGYDRLFNTNYGKGTSNEQLMLEHNWLPVYDCGQKVFVWNNKT